ncbi:MAG TPA: glycine cleavage T C-terminal barrel domain-containing protein [Clostridia bacterium]|nr:glycine cleavage T C-terminal barrel domain-containing protein [Clostridia bacterium]
MDTLELHELHQTLGARFSRVNGLEVVAQYGDPKTEYLALTETAGILDLSDRTRLCLTGADRVRFLHGQVTNDIKRLATGTGCYAALVTAKGKMQSDLNIHALADELLLDAEPGLGTLISQRLEKYIVADDVQVVDVSEMYGLLSVQGPAAGDCVGDLALTAELPGAPMHSVRVEDATLGELYVINQPRLNRAGFDLFVPRAALGTILDKLIAAAKRRGGGPCGWVAFETARIEAGIPRFGQDMNENYFPQECGIESRAVSYTKGCYIGQEILNRIHTIGHVTRELCRLRLALVSAGLPQTGDKLLRDGKEVGHLTSVAVSPKTGETHALGFLRKEAAQPGLELTIQSATAPGAIARV